MIRRSVDLPQPLGPMTETNSPQPISRLTLARAVNDLSPFPNTFVRFSAATCAGRSFVMFLPSIGS